MPITNMEKLGITDFLFNNKENLTILLKVASICTHKICTFTDPQEALDLILTKCENTFSLLSRRIINKEMLFHYLTQKGLPTTNLKTDMINTVIEFWNSPTFLAEKSTLDGLSINKLEATCNAGQESVLTTKFPIDLLENINKSEASCSQVSVVAIENNEPIFPINLLAKKFAEWFFNCYNENKLKADDIWLDARLQLQIFTNEGIRTEQRMGAVEVIDILMETKQYFGFYFNPNLTHTGVQGRMDVHGMVLVLACGTLHTQQTPVGIFEGKFGLVRDPFAENNWKVKNMQCMMRSCSLVPQQLPNLNESLTLKDALALPISMEELTKEEPMEV